MKKLVTLMLSAAMMNLLVSCGGDDAPPPPTVEFQSAAKTVGEGAGIVDITIELDKAAPKTITVRYSLTGTAIEGTTASSDYKVVGKYGEVEIAQGSASGSIQLDIKQDELVEANETIIITIDEVVSNMAKIGTLNQTTITLESDDIGAKVSFVNPTMEVTEGDQNVEVNLTLDKAPSQDVVVTYEFNYNFDVPTAIDAVWAEDNQVPTQYYDFYVDGTYGEITIPSGETSAKIILNIYTDFVYEFDEMIEINLTSASLGGTLGTNKKTNISVIQQDGKVLELDWDASYTDVDMDLFLFVGDIEIPTTNIEDYLIVAGSFNADYDGPESLFIPLDIQTASFGIACNYYEGTADPMNFEVRYIDYVSGVEDPVEANWLVFPGSYTLANVNPWFTSGVDPVIVHTFRMVDGVYQDFTAITTPPQNSRTKSSGARKFEFPSRTSYPKFQK